MSVPRTERETSEQSSPGDDEKSLARKQANRACDFCHRMKMKCIGKEEPPCNRCRASGHECTFDGPRKSKASKVEDRLKFMEDQMGNLQSTLSELVSMQRMMAGPSHPSASASASAHQVSLPQMPIHHHRPSFSSDFNPNPLAQGDMFSNHGVKPEQLYRSPSNSIPQANPSPVLYEQPIQPKPQQPQRQHSKPPPVPPVPRWEPPNENGSTAPGSDEEDEDPLNPAQLNAPFDNMLSLAEAARLKADGHLTDQPRPKPRSPVKRPSSHMPFDFGSPDGPSSSKKRRGTKLELGMEMPYPVERGDKPHAFPDVVALGYCTEAKGRELVDLFFSEASIYMPCYDPAVDTFDSLRKRSPFSITTLILVGSKIEDAAGAESELQKKCRDHAETISKNTLFSPIARVEMIQAQIILASWADTSGWRAGGHATRMAIDMGLYRCLPYLVRTGMGADRTPEQLEEEQALVVGARVWLTLFKMEYEMAFNLGRPAGIAAGETMKHARKFLDHPLAIRSDTRLVSYCEILSHRIPLHQPFLIAPNNDFLPDFDEKLRILNQQAEQWHEYWDQYLEARGVAEGDLLREGLHTAKAGTILYSNARILHGIRRRRDVTELSEERRHLLVKAVRAAEKIVNMCLNSGAYRKNFRSGNVFTHVSAAFASRFLIRMTSLVPEVVNARQIGRDVEQLAIMLSQVPGFQFASLLRDVLQRARRNKVLPPSSRPGSPNKLNHLPVPAWPSPLPTSTSTSNLSSTSLNANAPGAQGQNQDTFNFAFDQPVEPFPALDFSYAEQLFSHSGPGRNGGVETPINTISDPPPGFNMFMDPSYMDAFFPFPPIENDGMSTHSGGSVAPQHQPSPQNMAGFFNQQQQQQQQNPPQQQPQPQQNAPWW